MNKEIKLNPQQKEFLTGNLWKVILKMMVPTIIMMFVFGVYSFSDTILAIHFADDSYPSITSAAAHGTSQADQVRMFMGAFSPINMLILGIVFLFATGVSTRVAVNLGAKRNVKALDTLRTGVTTGMVISLILIPVLVFASKSWISSTIDNPGLKDWVADNTFDYALPIIIGLPFQLFSMLMTSMFRNEGRNKEMMIAMIVPILLNLVFDVIFMGPLKMNIAGGGLATTLSNVVSTIVFAVFILIYKKESILRFKNMFHYKLQYITLVGVFLVGIGAFFSNFAQSLTATLESNTIQQVSKHVYSPAATQAIVADPTLIPKSMVGMTPTAIAGPIASLKMYTQFQTLMPIFMLVFPLMFSMADAVKPIASFNFGAGEIERAKKSVWIILTYTFFSGIIIYFLFAFGLRPLLFSALSVDKHDPYVASLYDDTTKALWIMMAVLPFMAPLIAAQVWFGSTDKILGNLIVSSLWVITLIPLLYIFKAISMNSSVPYMFWTIYMVIGISSGVLGFTWTMISMKTHKETNLDIEAKIRIANKLIKSPKKLGKYIEDERKARREFISNNN